MERRPSGLETAALVGLLLLVAFPRARRLALPFDRGPAGERAARFAIDATEPAWTAGAPPVVPPSPARALARASVHALGAAPARVEAAVRAPFLALHVGAVLALWGALRRAHGRGLALLALAPWAAVPVALAQSGMPGPENAALCAALVTVLGLGLPRGAPLVALGALATASCDPRGLLLPGTVALVALARRRTHRTTLDVALCAAAAVALGLARGWSPALPAPAGRGWADVAPTLAAATAVGLAARALRAASPRWRARLAPLEVGAAEAREELVLPLAAGCAAATAATGALLWLTPALAAGTAALLAQVSRPLFSLRAGLAPLVVLTGLCALPALALFEVVARADAEPAPREVGARLAAELAPGEPLPPTLDVEGARAPIVLSWSDAYYAGRAPSRR